MSIKRVTTPLLVVVWELLKRPLEDRWAYELSRSTGLPPGTIQPILSRLEGEGWLDVRWEPVEEALEQGRRPRRLYRLTGSGAVAAQALVEEKRARLRALDPLLGGAAG